MAMSYSERAEKRFLFKEFLQEKKGTAEIMNLFYFYIGPYANQPLVAVNQGLGLINAGFSILHLPHQGSYIVRHIMSESTAISMSARGGQKNT